METATIEKDLLRLPERIAKKLRGKRIEIAEIKGSILLKPTGNPIAEARGFLKGKRFTNGPFDDSTGFGEVFKLQKEIVALPRWIGKSYWG